MTTTVQCAFCEGTGKDYFGLLANPSDCLVCLGTGIVNVEEPSLPCIYCRGSGKNPLGSRVPCIVCKGKGMVQGPRGEVCTKCKGSGASLDHLPCTACQGKGFVER